jgi:hypothetical protein
MKRNARRRLARGIALRPVVEITVSSFTRFKFLPSVCKTMDVYSASTDLFSRTCHGISIALFYGHQQYAFDIYLQRSA